MREPKTKKTQVSVQGFIDKIKDEQVREDCHAIAALMQAATQSKPHMYGASIVGFGSRSYTYADGRVMNWMQMGFSPRQPKIVLYVYSDFKGGEALMAALGKYQCGKSCIYLKRLSDMHLPTLKKLLTGSVRHLLKTHPPAVK